METEVQRIVGRILQDANEKAKKILEGAKNSAEALLENRRWSARQKAAEDRYSLLRKAESEAEAVRGSMIADSKRKASWMIVSEKERLVTSVLDEVKRRLEDLKKSDRYITILEKIIIDAGTVLGGGELEVMLNERDSTLPLNFNELAEAISKKTGRETRLKLSEENIKASGGALVKSADGEIFADNTFEDILKRRERDLRLKIVRILFK